MFFRQHLKINQILIRNQYKQTNKKIIEVVK